MVVPFDMSMSLVILKDIGARVFKLLQYPEMLYKEMIRAQLVMLMRPAQRP